MRKKLTNLILAIILIGCTPIDLIKDQKTINPPDIGIPITPNGEVIDITAPEGWNSFKVGEPVFLLAQNLSNEEIIFEYDFSAKIFVLQEDGWIEVKDNIINEDTSDIILEPNKERDVHKTYSPILLPDISSNSTDVVTLRIFVVGNVYKDGQITNQQIATYIDLQLNTDPANKQIL